MPLLQLKETLNPARAQSNYMLQKIVPSAGPKGEGGLDDATGASKAAGGGASMKQTSQTINLGEFLTYEFGRAFLYNCVWSGPTICAMCSVGKVSRGDEGDAFGMGFRFPWQKKEK